MEEKIRRITKLLNSTVMLKSINPLWHKHVIKVAEREGVSLEELPDIISIEQTKIYATGKQPELFLSED